MSRRNRGGVEAGVLLLAYQLWSAGVHNVPPVTLAAIAGMTAVYLGYVPPLDAVYETRMSYLSMCTSMQCRHTMPTRRARVLQP